MKNGCNWCHLWEGASVDILNSGGLDEPLFCTSGTCLNLGTAVCGRANVHPQGFACFFVKILVQGLWSLLQLLNFALVMQKQP